MYQLSVPLLAPMMAEITVSTIDSMIQNALLRTTPPPQTADQPLDNLINTVLLRAWAPSTLPGYDRSVKRFLEFCSEMSIPTDQQLPASEYALCAYIASTAGHRAGSTSRNDISGIRAWHIANNVPFEETTRLKYVLKGVKNMAPECSRKPLRRPVTHDMLVQLHSQLDLSDPFDACVAFTADSCEWGQIRLGEVLPTTEGVFDHRLHPSVSDLSPRSVTGNSQKLRLPWTKTTGFVGAKVILCRQLGASDVLTSLDRHLEVNKIPHNYPLFCYDTTGGHKNMTKRKFLARCNSVWSRFGHPHFSGHCFRIGGTTELLLRGVPPDVVRLMGRWSSDSFLRYWRELDSIAPLYAELLKPFVLPSLPQINKQQRSRR